MGLQQCHECEKDVSSEAKLCPNCGAPVKKQTSSIVIIGGGLIVLFLFIVLIAVFITSLFNTGNNTPSTPTVVSDPKSSTDATIYRESATDAQIYREFEICMNAAKKTVDDNKLEGQAIAFRCMGQLQKYGDKRARKAFNTYFE